MDEFMTMVSGLVYYYGVLKNHDLYRLMRELLPEETGDLNRAQVLERLQKGILRMDNPYPVLVGSGYVYYRRVEKPKEILLQQEKRPSLDYRLVTREEAAHVVAGEEHLLWGEAGHNLENWLLARSGQGELFTRETVSGCVNAIRNGVEPGQLLQDFSFQVRLRDFDEAQEAARLLMELWDHIPHWELKGWTPAEVMERFEKPHMRPLPDQPFPLETGRSPGVKPQAKVGRNDPCPCGSGKKYKHCCLNKDQEAEEISNHGLEIIDRVKRGDLPLLESLEAINDRHPGLVSAPVTKASPEEWERLLRAFLDFIAIEPWQWMSDLDLFAVEIPGDEELYYGLVLGNAGEVFGLAVYPGEAGIQYYLRQSEETEALGPELMFEEIGPTWLLSLGNRDELLPAERKIYRELGYRFRGHNGWPVFRSMLPGYYNWMLDADEVRKATLVLEEAGEVARYCEKHQRQWGNRQRRNLIPRVQVGQTLEQLEKKVEWIEVPEFQPLIEQIPIDELRFKRMVREMTRRQGAWEIDWFASPIPTQEHRNERPSRPRVYMIADHETGILINMAMTSPEAGDPGGLLADTIEKLGFIPERLVAKNQDKGLTMQPICTLLDCELMVEDELAIDEVKFSLLDYSWALE